MDIALNWRLALCTIKCGNKGKKVCKDCFRLPNGKMSAYVKEKK